MDYPLFKAARKGNAVAVERLCKNGADPNQRLVKCFVFLVIENRKVFPLPAINLSD